MNKIIGYVDSRGDRKMRIKYWPERLKGRYQLEDTEILSGGC